MEITIKNKILSIFLIFAILACSNKGHESAVLITPELKLSLTLEKGVDQSTAVVSFDVTNGWHIYGPNPQKNGRPSSVIFSSEQGSFANTIWPNTKTFDEGSSGLSEGYDRTFEVRAELKEKNNLATKIKAKITWVTCKDICVPGEAELST